MHDLLLEKVRARSGEFKTLLPTKDEAGRYVTGLLALLFARSHGVTRKNAAQLWLAPSSPHRKSARSTDIASSLLPAERCRSASAMTFYHKPSCQQIYDVLWQDAEAAYAGDPAAQNLQEVVLAYPGFFGVAVYRIAHYLQSLGIATLPRLFSEHAHEKTGIDIHPAATIGRSFFMDHGTGIVIGGTSVIADNVKIYQGVTLGALSVDKSLATTKRHPTIEEGVVIYAGATILGGETVIGRNSVIGGNTWIVESVAPHSVVYNKSSVRVRPSREVSDLIDFSI
jgi:serine O-acetyltransferase